MIEWMFEHFDPWLVYLGSVCVAYMTMGVAIFVNLCLMRYFWRKFRGKP